MINRFIIIIINLYRRFISPLFPPVCRFSPSCSRYAVEVLREWGTIRGLYYTMRRILKCNPLFAGGCDPPPERVQSLILKKSEGKIRNRAK